ncbi:MAG: hypothetical protein MJZ98_01360 [Paludibacteraceae bacterium]|nr:hypothetical protein [Paludibacteraceae bacterium]
MGVPLIELTLQDQSECIESVGGDCYIKVVSNTLENVELPAYSYAEYNGRKWYVKERYLPQIENGYYSYSVMLYKPQNVLDNTIFARPVTVTDESGVETSWLEPNFALNANKQTMCEVVIDCIESTITNRRTDAFGSEFVGLSLPPDCDYGQSELLAFSFAGVSIKKALDDIASAYECNWWIDGGILYMQKQENSTIIDLSDDFVEVVGQKGNISGGIASIKLGNTKEKASRLFVYGSDRNITAKQARANGMDVSFDNRLRLKENHTYQIPLADGSFYSLQTDERGAVGAYGGREEVVMADDIYPSMTFAITNAAVSIVNNEGKEIWKCRAQSVDSTPSIRGKKIEIADVSPSIVFSSGLLNGMTFEVRFVTNNETFGSFDFYIVPLESSNTLIPSGTFVPKAYDTFNLLGVKMSDAYIEEAQDWLAARAYEILKQNESSFPVATIETEPRFIIDNNVSISLGDRVRVNSERVMNGYINRVEYLRYSLTFPYDIELRLSEKKIEGIIRQRELDFSNIWTNFDNVTSGLFGDNRFIDINTDDRFAKFGTLVDGVAGGVPTGMVTDGGLTFSGELVLSDRDRWYLQGGSLRKRIGNTVKVPSVDIDLNMLEPHNRYRVVARWAESQEYASVFIEDITKGGDIELASEENQCVLGFISFSDNTDSWTWKYGASKAMTIFEDGTISTDVSREEVDVINKGHSVSLATRGMYISEELVLSDEAVKALRMRLGLD